MTASSNELISAEELNGIWEYKCTVLTGGKGKQGFPDEFIKGDKNITANQHGGEVEFLLVRNGNTGINHVEVNGKRLWRKLIDVDDSELASEDLDKPKLWTQINFSLVYPEDLLLYQYEIENTGVTGITNVHMIRNHECGKLVMEGWFYYVPNSSSLEEMNTASVSDKIIAEKQNKRWLATFGKVELKKVG